MFDGLRPNLPHGLSKHSQFILKKTNIVGPMKFLFILMIVTLIPQLSYAEKNKNKKKNNLKSNLRSLTIRRNIVLTSDEKLKYFIRGRIKREKSVSMDKMKTSYCAFENSQMENKTIPAKSVLELAPEKMSFPNKKIIRYSLINSKTSGPQLFCDFTDMKKFNPKKLRSYINRQLGPWARAQ